MKKIVLGLMVVISIIIVGCAKQEVKEISAIANSSEECSCCCEENCNCIKCEQGICDGNCVSKEMCETCESSECCKDGECCCEEECKCEEVVVEATKSCVSPYCSPDCDGIDCHCNEFVNCNTPKVIETTKPKKEYKKVMTYMDKIEILKDDRIECVDENVLNQKLRVREVVELFWYDEDRMYQSIIAKVVRTESRKIVFEEVMEE